MEKLSATLERISQRLGADSEARSGARPVTAVITQYKCQKCKDAGWIASDQPVIKRGGHVEFPVIRCSCKSEDDKVKRARYLLKMDGLTEVERTRRFSNIEDAYAPGVLTGLKLATEEGRGLITLVGGYGVGKSTLLMCAVNEGRDMGKLAIYTTLTDLLSYLRSTFSPDSEDSFDQYWDALINADILALDELDEPKTTDWALEKFMRLMDERWRRMEDRLTLCAINNRVQSLPGKIQSRLRDGRAEIITIEGQDMRIGNAWAN